MLSAIAIALLGANMANMNPDIQPIKETKAQKAARMKWWSQSRFGMFIHWGVYSVPAGKYKDSTRFAEWIMESAHVPLAEYEQWRDQFNPTKFNADQWATMAADAGVKYVVITTKHHDGFALFDSKVSDWDIMSTPFKRDIMKELSTAVRKKGLVQGWYHSIMDWHHPDYVPHRPWSTVQPADTNFDRYVKYLHDEVTELLTNYGPIGVMWFDGEWESTWNHERGEKLYNLCRTLQPNVIVNNRVDVGRGGMGGMSDLGYCGDYGTPEQTVPDQGIPGVDWESCITMNDNWGYNAWDKDFKSSSQLVQMLCDIVSKGGNLLLNVGPRPDGTFPPESVDRLAQIGKWMKVNSPSIYGTTASEFANLPWGRSTTKIGATNSTIYLQVFDFPKDGQLTIPGIGNSPISARVLGQRNNRSITRKGGDLVIDLHGVKADPYATVVELKVKGKPIIYAAPKIVTNGNQFVNTMKITIETGSSELQARYTTDGSTPKAASPLYKDPITVSKTTHFKVLSFHHGNAVSSLSDITVTKVTPWNPVAAPMLAKHGLYRFRVDKSFDKMPADIFAIRQNGVAVTDLNLGPIAKQESVLLHYNGFINVPTSDMYHFSLTSDDGSVLYIDGKLVIDNDGLHSPQEKSGYVPLGNGFHKFDLVWFNKTGGAALDLRWAQSGDPLTQIPNSAFYYLDEVDAFPPRIP